MSKIYNAAVRQFVKLFVALFTAFLILNSLSTGTSLTLEVGSVSVSVSKAYYLAVYSLIYLVTFHAFNHLVASLYLRTSATLSVRKAGFSAEAFRMIKGEEEMSLGGPIVQNHFLKERLPIAYTLSVLVLLCYATFLIPLIGFGIFGMNIQYQLITNADINALEKIAAVVGLAIGSISYLYLFLFYVPLPYEKNVSFIRWTVLHCLPRAIPKTNDSALDL